MHWIILFIAGFFETLWVICLKYSNGFTKLIPSVLTAVFLAVSMILLAIALKKIPMGTGYAIWTGIGAACTAVLGMYLFDEPREIARFVFIGLILAGIIGLKITG
jgi:quaternary ammonium compound-resistance protein SugE